MRTLKEIQELYQQAGVKALRDVELLQLLGINLESCDFLELFKSSREALLRKGFRASTAVKLNARGEVAHRYSKLHRSNNATHTKAYITRTAGIENIVFGWKLSG